MTGHRTTIHASVIDLASGTMTSIDFQKKQYSVITFKETKQMMEQMSQKMQKNDKAEMSSRFRRTNGQDEEVSGFEAKEMIMKLEMEGTDKDSGQKGGMTVTTDMWIAPGVPGYQESANSRNAWPKAQLDSRRQHVHVQPAGLQGMAEVYKEVAKLDGMPVQQLISMGVAGQPPAAGAEGSAAPAQQQPAAQPQPQQQSAPPTSVGGAIGGALGSRFGLGRKKPAADQPAHPGQWYASAGSPPGPWIPPPNDYRTRQLLFNSADASYLQSRRI